MAKELAREELVELFRNPPLEYSDFVTWFWEAGELNKKQLTWQLEELKKKGMGGTWFYPRYLSGEPYGTSPAYFSEEWWDFFRHSVAEHKRLGLEAWTSGWEGRGSWRELLREDREAMPELTGLRLVLYESAAEAAGPLYVEVPEGEQILSAVAYLSVQAGLDGASAQDVSDTVDGQRVAWDAPGPGWVLAVVVSQPHDLDYLNPAVAQRYIDIYWQPHEDHLREYLGDTLTLYGQDEMFTLDGTIFFSPSLLDRFMSEKGYDPRPLLAGLFRDIGDLTDKIRCEYYELMSAMVDENYYGRLAKWNTDRGIRFGTIATWGRQDMLGQTWHYGDFFRLMRWFDVTGNEDPNSSDPGNRCFIDAKLSSSVLHVYERQRAGMCVYWGSGWGMTQEQNVAWTNENYAYGLNLYNQHGGLYSTLGGWYEWVPPSIHWRQPYWDHWKTFVDYVSRLSVALSHGVHCPDVALFYPLTTVHANWLGGDRFTSAADDTATETFAVARRIYNSGIDFDFVNDDILDQAEVVDGLLKVAGIEFRAVVLPPMTTIKTGTLEKLKAFYDGGGTIVAFRGLPAASAEAGRNDPHVREVIEAIFGFPSSDEYNHSTRVHTQATDSIHVQRNSRGGQAFFVPSQELYWTKHARRGPSVPAVISNAITQDVRCSGEDVFHTHQKVGDVDVYFLYNVRAETRDLEFTFRVRGQPEVWDCSSGAVTPYHRFTRDGQRTKVRLAMDPLGGVVLVFSPGGSRPGVVDDSLDAVSSVDPVDGGLLVRGVSVSAGKKRVRVENEGQEYAAETRVGASPAPLALGGTWDFELKPTMNNQWGDFRYPASDDFIGAEAREFRYHEEAGEPGTELGWHEADFDAGHWPSVIRTYGPYWYASGAYLPDEVPLELVQQGRAGELDPGAWERFTFSERFGYERLGDPSVWGGRQGVLDEFIYFATTGNGADARRYMATFVRAPGAGSWELNLGTKAGRIERLWLNGAEVLSSAVSPEAPVQVSVALVEGLNTLLVELEHTGGDAIRAYVALTNPDDELPSEGPPAVPRLRWFTNPTGLVYDIAPGKERRVGWYRFEAPAGTVALQLGLDAEAVQAWVDGEPVAVNGSTLRLSQPAHAVVQVALRVEQRPGVYAGSAIPEPVKFETVPTVQPLGDWCEYALEGYSGAAIYSKGFLLDPRHLQGKVILDLGSANTVAEVAVNGKPIGVGLGRPYRFDITDQVTVGENHLNVTVYNTLANFYDVGELKSAFVFEGQTLSGLIGPVQIEFQREVTLLARPVAGA